MANKSVKPKKTCVKCNRTLVIDLNFYKCDSPLFPDGYFHLCRKCLISMIENRDDGYEVALMALHAMDKPMLLSVWEDTNVGNYFRQINSLRKEMTWEESDFDVNDVSDDKKEKSDVEESNKDHIDLDYLESKWGSGYTHQEYKFFEKKYNILKNNYPEKTSMHTEALLTYIRYRVKEEMATSVGEVKIAKEWGNLASKAATDAKINPSQLSQADLTDGLDTFGQLARAVEQVEDVIEILPKFKEKPADKPDFTIWSYINYARDLEGKPLVDYSDVYEFYEKRKQEYEDEFDFLQENDS